MTRQDAVNLLVVDDETFVRDVVTRVLSNAGFACGQADDVQAAWQYLYRHDVHLITLDVTMPGRSGLEFLYEVQEAFPDTAVIMLTACRSAEMSRRALMLGASAYLLKPVDHEELLFHVQRGLERRQLILDRREGEQRFEQQLEERMRMIHRSHEETIHRLVSAARFRDIETAAHFRRVGLYSELMAEALGWPASDVERIRLAAPMHDVGKFGIPETILHKPGRLTGAEYEVVKAHTRIGSEILADSSSPILQLAREIAMFHHEWWDGTGYPQGLAGTEIPESARIVAIVDVYDALSHDRVYRPALPEAEVLRLLGNGRGSQFDPSLLDLFFILHREIRAVRETHPDEGETGAPPRSGWYECAELGHSESHASDQPAAAQS